MSRYLVTETPYIMAEFKHGDSVTVTVYDMQGNPVPVKEASATEIASTGVFQWSTTLLTNPIPTSGLTRYLFVMDNGSLKAVQSIEWGGYPDLILGLSQSNVYIDSCVYDEKYGGLASARLRIYDDAAHVGTTTGVIATYHISAVVSAPGQFSVWKQVKA